MYSHILVPVADDETPERTDAALTAARLLMSAEARLSLLHVTEPIPGYVASYLPEGALDHARQETQAMLEAVADRAGMRAETAIVSGHGGRAIVDHAERTGVDCIVISSHRPGFQDVFFGSTAAHVVRHAPCSVHVLR
jgi:nucleotide-binding universal stress UspA family protein